MRAKRGEARDLPASTKNVVNPRVVSRNKAVNTKAARSRRKLSATKTSAVFGVLLQVSRWTGSIVCVSGRLSGLDAELGFLDRPGFLCRVFIAHSWPLVVKFDLNQQHFDHGISPLPSKNLVISKL